MRRALAIVLAASAAAAAEIPAAQRVRWLDEIAALVERQDVAGLTARFEGGGTLFTDRMSEPVSGDEAVAEGWRQLLGGGAADAVTHTWGTAPVAHGDDSVSRMGEWILFGQPGIATHECLGRVFARTAEEAQFREDGRVARMEVRMSITTRWLSEELQCDKDEARMMEMMGDGLYEIEDTMYAVGEGVGHLSVPEIVDRFSPDEGLSVQYGDGPAGAASDVAGVEAVWGGLLAGLRHASAFPWVAPWANVDARRGGVAFRTYSLVHANGCSCTFDAVESVEVDDVNRISRLVSRWTKTHAQVRAELDACAHRSAVAPPDDAAPPPPDAEAPVLDEHDDL